MAAPVDRNQEIPVLDERGRRAQQGVMPKGPMVSKSGNQAIFIYMQPLKCIKKYGNCDPECRGDQAQVLQRRRLRAIPFQRHPALHGPELGLVGVERDM
ncbi:hypothetical protein NDU88_003261 [Pleurodeles waltl]|uniref:Uncharacterized protein n=1 Tax=Pleurodeles waltl TaxID=8319 RepID=A0AAV7UDI5_PLEWA|nr:hypothetical protein NDU88_003261 [Pleurodeles waltl]